MLDITQLDKMHHMLAEYQRGEGQSVSFMARVNDLRYDAHFGKSRRQRLMDIRVAKNAQFVQKVTLQLNDIAPDQQVVEHICEEAQNYFFCSLSQTNVKDVMLNPDDKCDCIGFGLAVKRPEHVLDEPTAVSDWEKEKKWCHASLVWKFMMTSSGCLIHSTINCWKSSCLVESWA